jgi:cyclic beta-1,2-glucan synthetase
MYRLGVERILGLQRAGDVLRIAPCIPKAWPGYVITYRHGATRYRIEVENPNGVSCGTSQVLLDGVMLDGNSIGLRDDGGDHCVSVLMG